MYLHARHLRHHAPDARDGRYALSKVAMTPKGLISTDGHLLLFVPWPTVKAKEAPVIEGTAPSSPPDHVLLVDPDDLKRAADMAPKKALNPANELVHVALAGERVSFAATDGDRVQRLDAKVSEGSFPDVAQVIPDYKEAHVVTFDLALLLKGLKTLQGASTSETVTLRLLHADAAVGFSTADGAALVVMPCTVDNDKPHNPDGLVPLKKAKRGAPKGERKAKVPAPAAPSFLPPDERETNPDPESEMDEAEAQAAEPLAV